MGKGQFLQYMVVWKLEWEKMKLSTWEKMKLNPSHHTQKSAQNGLKTRMETWNHLPSEMGEISYNW